MSHESTPKRKYELKKRAEEMAETHRRITQAAIELHGTVGPSRTTMSAVAKRAGVERRTLYRHFPTEADLFVACSTHYFRANPWPDLGSWRATRNPHERLETALEELFAYYERTEPMFNNVLRDAELVDVARDAVVPLQAYLEEAAEVLAVGRPGRRRHPRRSVAPRTRVLDVAVAVDQRHRSTRGGETRHRTRRRRRHLTALAGNLGLAAGLVERLAGVARTLGRRARRAAAASPSPAARARWPLDLLERGVPGRAAA